MRPSRATSGIGQVWKLSNTFVGDLAALGRGGVVDGAELLVALPGQVDLVGRVAGVEAGG